MKNRKNQLMPLINIFIYQFFHPVFFYAFGFLIA